MRLMRLSGAIAKAKGYLYEHPADLIQIYRRKGGERKYLPWASMRGGKCSPEPVLVAHDELGGGELIISLDDFDAYFKVYL